MDIRARAVKWLYEKFRPATPQASKTSTKERLKRFAPSFHMPKLSIAWIFVLALIGISAAIATIATVWVFGFPEMPQMAWPRFQFNWSAMRIIAIGLSFVAVFLWLALKIRKRKRAATSANFVPTSQVPAPGSAVVSAVTPVTPIPPITTLTPPATPPPIAPTRRRGAPQAATAPPVQPAPILASAGVQQAAGGAPTGIRPYIGHIGLAFGLAATLVLFLSRNGGKVPTPAAPGMSQTEGAQGTAQAQISRAAQGIVLNVGDEVTVKAGKECSPTYKPVAEKIIRIIGVNPERHYLIKTVSGQYEMGPGLPPVPGAIPRVSICSLDDEPVEVWMAVEEPPRPTAKS